MRQQRVLAAVLMFLGLGLPLCAQCRFAKSTPARTLTYRFESEASGDALVLHVILEFTMDVEGKKALVVPTQWAGEKLHAVSNVRPISAGSKIDEHAVVYATPNSHVVIAYDLKKDWTGPLVNPLQFHPIVMPEYFEFTGSNALVVPRLESSAPEKVNFDWQKLPQNWALATSFGTAGSYAARCQSHTGPWADVDEGVYAGGDFRIRKFQVGRRPVVLAIRGEWKFTDNEAIGQISKVIGTVRAFWHDDRFPYFLVTLKPYDRDHGSSDGSAFTNAFWMYVSRLDSLSGLLPQLAHESFHAWDPMRMGGQFDSDSEMNSIKWFREGPTDYYAYLLTFKAGEFSGANYVESLNRDLRKFPTSDSEYVRGRIISLWLDDKIRQESGGRHSLDNVMYDMVRDGRKPLTLERIFETAGHYSSAATLATLRSAVTEHADLEAPTQLPGVKLCAHAAREQLFTFDLGLDFDRTQAANKVVGVVPSGPAYVAGLRDDQLLHGRLSVSKGDPDKPAIFTIRTSDGDKEISFYPRGNKIAAWQYHLDGSGACR